MAAPTYVSSGTFVSGTGNLTPGLPSGWAQDDIFIMVVNTTFGVTVTAPSGWAHVTGSPASPGAEPKIHVLWKRAGASESAPTVTDPGGAHGQTARISAFRGCITTGNPWDVAGASTDGAFTTAVSASAVTTTVVDTLVVICVTGAASSGAMSFSGWTNGSLSSLTERVDSTAIPGGSLHMGTAVVTGVKASAGPTGTTTGTSNNNSNDAIIVLALKSGAAPPAETAPAGAVSATAVANTAIGAGQRKANPGTVTASVVASTPSAVKQTLAGSPQSSVTANSATIASGVAALAGEVTAATAIDVLVFAYLNDAAISVTTNTPRARLIPQIMVPAIAYTPTVNLNQLGVAFAGIALGAVTAENVPALNAPLINEGTGAVEAYGVTTDIGEWGVAGEVTATATIDQDFVSLELSSDWAFIESFAQEAAASTNIANAGEVVVAVTAYALSRHSVSIKWPRSVLVPEEPRTLEVERPKQVVLVHKEGPVTGAVRSLSDISAVVIRDPGLSVSVLVNGVTSITSGTAALAGYAITSVAVESVGVRRVYAVDIGNGTSTSFTVTHNLASRDVLTVVYEAASPYEEVEPTSIEHTTTNTVTVTFQSAPTTNQYRVVVVYA